MPRSFAQIVSIERIRLWAKATIENDGRPFLAKAVLSQLECGNEEAAEAAFFDCLPAHFYNLSAAAKRRFADAVTLAFCDTDADADELFELMKRRKVTGRTTTRA
jgi:hypothetical protein